MASLQLNGSHICSSGIFQAGFLLTTCECACNIGIGIELEKRRATAVFANPNLKDGRRIDILKIAYYTTCENFDSETGVIMVN